MYYSCQNDLLQEGGILALQFATHLLQKAKKIQMALTFPIAKHYE